VWSPQSKSSLINTILLGLPLPIFFIRNNTDVQTKKTIREVVDGQQRLRAIFDFIDNGFPLSKVQNEQYGGLLFTELDKNIRSDILSYELTVNVLDDLDDKGILDIFARINSYGVTLNGQELLNAKYFGYFKQMAYNLGFSFTKFWEKNKIFTNANIMRMKEVELVSELLVAMLDGIQDVKALDKYYNQYDESFDKKDIITNQFCETMDYFSSLYDGDFSNTQFSSSILFYAAFVAIYHQKYGIKNMEKNRKPLDDNDRAKIRMAFDEISNILQKKENILASEQNFIISCKKSTGHKINKITRCSFIIDIINKHLGI
jgi:hypothetical protein